MVKPRKTSGREWLYLSMAEFNGSGYADKFTPQDYVDSYTDYKAYRKHTYALEQLQLYPEEALWYAEKLVFAREASHVPSKKNYDKFLAFRKQRNSQVRIVS